MSCELPHLSVSHAKTLNLCSQFSASEGRGVAIAKGFYLNKLTVTNWASFPGKQKKGYQGKLLKTITVYACFKIYLYAAQVFALMSKWMESPHPFIFFQNFRYSFELQTTFELLFLLWVILIFLFLLVTHSKLLC